MTCARIASSACPPNHELIPNQPAAINARARAGTCAPRTPNHNRANTGYGMPKRVPACETSKIAPITIRLPINTVESTGFPPTHPEGDHASRERECRKVEAHPNPERCELRLAPAVLVERARSQILVPPRFVRCKLRLRRGRQHHYVGEAFLGHRHYCATSFSLLSVRRSRNNCQVLRTSRMTSRSITPITISAILVATA